MLASGMPINKGGRPPVKINEELLERVLDRVSRGETIREIARQPGMPSAPTMHKWLRDDEEAFKSYQLAKEIKSHQLFDEAVELARGLVAKPKGLNVTISAQTISATKIAIETLMAAAAKLNPSDYGQRKAGDIIVPIQIVTTMNLGQGGQAKPGDTANIYELTLEPIKVIDVSSTDEDN